MTTINDLIRRSIDRNEITHADYDPTLAAALEAECTGSVVGNDEEEFRGVDANGNEWRVHLALPLTADDVY